MSETITAADGTEHDVTEVALREQRQTGSTDNPIIRFVNDGSAGLNITVDPCSILKIDADELVAEELDVDTDKIADLLEHRLDGRKVGNYRVGSIEVHEEHGVVVDADIHADVKKSDSREELESDIVSTAN
jgi:hypothetical protein